MPYRNGTYVAFHANGQKEPTESDIKYYNLLKAWDANPNHDFEFTDSHEKTGAIRDKSLRATVAQSLRTRLNNSKNMVLIIGQTTREDTDWVPMEIEHAVDVCRIPIIAAYTGYSVVLNPNQLSNLWPNALAARISANEAHVIHIAFAKHPLVAAVAQFSHENYPLGGGLGIYSAESYKAWGLLR